MALGGLGGIYERQGKKKEAIDVFEQLYRENIDRHGVEYLPNRIVKQTIDRLKGEV